MSQREWLDVWVDLSCAVMLVAPFFLGYAWIVSGRKDKGK
jgi:hypothetical protein